MEVGAGAETGRPASRPLDVVNVGTGVDGSDRGWGFVDGEIWLGSR